MHKGVVVGLNEGGRAKSMRVSIHPLYIYNHPRKISKLHPKKRIWNILEIGEWMKHIVFYSGGIGSWATAKRVVAKYGKKDVILLFTDTLIEDEDLYRFIDQTVAELGVEYHRIADGRTPFDVYKDERYLGNSRIAPCSHKLKQDTATKWVKGKFKPDECILYLGIDWTEEHRKVKPTENWSPYQVRFPMCEEPFLTKDETLSELEQLGIETPRLYKMGFAHNNCGGFCCRAGQGHFANLLKQMPERFADYEAKEEEMRQYLDRDVAMMKKTKNKVSFPYTLRQLREDIEAKNPVDMTDIGGCGCMVDSYPTT
jgi:3'-phosphoadenosine 5'-phosphosulfate sulfotransferase (PAPS reductase)/FAD synthetase